MNVTFNNANYNNTSINNRTLFNSNKSQNPAFTAALNVPKDSSLLSGVEKQYDKLTEAIARKFTAKVLDSKPMNWLADKLKNSNNLFQHCLTTGSVITSGLYMYKTVTNDKLDKDRKNTLAVNQGLTLLVSTAGAYGLDKYINPWWEKQTAKFIGNQLKDEKFYDNFIKTNNAIKEANKELKAKGNTVDLKSSKRALDMLFENTLYKNMTESAQSALNNKVKGFGALKSMIVFGMVYRYLVPVLVTKPSNALCEKYLEYKKNKDAQKNIKNA